MTCSYQLQAMPASALLKLFLFFFFACVLHWPDDVYSYTFGRIYRISSDEWSLSIMTLMTVVNVRRC